MKVEVRINKEQGILADYLTEREQEVIDMTVDERLREMLADNGLNKEEVDAIVGALDDRKHERNQDVAVADEAYEEYVKSGKKSRPIEEFWDELGI